MEKAKTKKIILTSLITLTFLVSLLTFPSTLYVSKATPNGTVVKIVPASQTVGTIGEPLPVDFSINVTVEDVTDLYTWQVQIEFDPNAIEAINASIPPDNIFAGKSTFPSPLDIDNDAGYIKYGNTLLGNIPGVTASGILCTIDFRAVKNGTYTLSFDETETFLLDPELRDILPTTTEDGSVTIQGKEVTGDPSTITIQVSTTEAYLGETIHINGSITPTPVQPNNTNVNLYYQYSGKSPVNFAVVKTQNGKYEYEWDTLTLRDDFVVKKKRVLNFTVWAEWSGDSQYLGDESENVTITITLAFTKLKVDYADETHRWIGEENIFVTEAAPCTFNVTVFNVTNLDSWRVKIYYPDAYVYFDEAWIPEHNVFGENYTASAVETGTDTEGAYITFSANNTGTPAQAFNTTALLFQFNFSAKFPTTLLGAGVPMYFSQAETALLNSTGHKIPAMLEGCNIVVRGVTSELRVINPEATEESKKHIFDFYTTDTSVGHKFNVTIQVFNVFDLFAWRLKLTYNSTLLNAARGWFPSWNETTDVLYGRQVNSTLTNISINQTEGVVNMTCFLKQGEQKFTGNGTLAIIEFEILTAPAEGESYTCELIIDYKDETVLSSDGQEWYRPRCYDGAYSFIGGSPEEVEEEGGFDWTWYIVLGVVIVVIVVAAVLYWRRKKKSFEY